MAVENLKRIYDIDQSKALKVLCKPVKNLFFSGFSQKLTPLKFAVSAEMKNFISHPAAQKCFKLFWAGELLPIEEQIFNTWPKVLFYIEILLIMFIYSYFRSFLFQFFCCHFLYLRLDLSNLKKKVTTQRKYNIINYYKIYI
jgi:hypothetical protein